MTASDPGDARERAERSERRLALGLAGSGGADLDDLELSRRHRRRLLAAAPDDLRLDEAAAVLRWRRSHPPYVPPVLAVHGAQPTVRALLERLDGHPALVVAPLPGWPVLHSAGLQRRAAAAAGGAAGPAAVLAGWLDVQGLSSLWTRWLVVAEADADTADRVLELSDDGAEVMTQDRRLVLPADRTATEVAWAARLVVGWLGVGKDAALKRATRNRQTRGGAVVAPDPADGADPGEEPLAVARELSALASRRALAPVAVTQPLVLISQIQRSGGTLLSQLLDGHPELHAHPHELRIAHPDPKRAWTTLDASSSPSKAFYELDEAVPRWIHDGFQKATDATPDASGAIVPRDRSGTPRQPFLLAPSVVRRIFFDEVARSRPANARGFLDAWFTAYFNGWLDNRNLHGEKRWVTAFAAVLATLPGVREAFLSDYPDGRLIGIVREPASWWASARAYRLDRYRDRDPAIERWCDSTRALLTSARDEPDRTLLLDFAALAGDTDATMRRVSRWLGIEDHERLRDPTFNGEPAPANTSFADDGGTGVLAAPVDRRDLVAPDDRAAIERAAGGLHAEALAVIEASAAQLDR